MIALTLLIHVAFGLVVGVRALGWLSFLELAAYDLLLQPARGAGAATTTPAPEALVVAYTEADEARYGYPLPDRELADLLERLIAAEPVALGLDLIRDRPEPPTGTAADQRRLAAALTAHPAVIGILKETAPGFGPPPALADRPEQLAAADIVKDPDGTVRRGLLFLTAGTTTRPSLALQLAARWLLAAGVQPAWDGAQFRLGATVHTQLDPRLSGFYGPAVDAGGYQVLMGFPACSEGFRHIPVHEVLDGGIDAEAIGGRMVLIGNTVRAAKDRRKVPGSIDSIHAGNGRFAWWASSCPRTHLRVHAHEV